MSEKTLIQLFDDAEAIGVIGSPSSTTKITLDILGLSAKRNLVGELAMFRYTQDDFDHYALGQINEIILKNRWLEDPTILSIVRERERLEGVSERQDTHRGEMIISAVFADQNGTYLQGSLGTVPATSTRIRTVGDPFLDKLLQPYKDQISYLGTVYGSTPKLPLWFKHFDEGPDGAGEAYHLGIFGKTGSGKSVLAKMILLAYARHPQMGLFILDPVGEFSKGLNGNSSDIISMGQILSSKSLDALSRPYEVFDLSRFFLDSWDLFGELLLEFRFFRELGIRTSQNQADASYSLIDFLRSSQHKLSALDTDAFESSLGHLRANIERVYVMATAQNRVLDFISEAEQNPDSPAKRRWDQTIKFFLQEKHKVSIPDIISKALTIPQESSRPLIVVDLSKRPKDIPETTWNENIKPLLIDRFLSNLIRKSESTYQEGQSFNTLVVLDEAQRLAPRGRTDSERKDQIKNRLIDAAITTRKYGLGWMFISLSLSSLDNAIIGSGLRSFFFGFGLGIGTELTALRDLVGGSGKAIELYQRFRDPGSALDSVSREYSFMTIGPVSPLSFAGTPLFLNVFTNPCDFLSANQILGVST